MPSLQSDMFALFDSPQVLADALLKSSDNSTGSHDMPSHIQADILAPLEPLTLTATELNGGVDEPDSPNLAQLVKEWHLAFSHIPRGHSICQVQFNMSTSHDMTLRHIVRLLQATSTVIKLKAASQSVSFSVYGCSAEQKAYLEAALPSSSSIT